MFRNSIKVAVLGIAAASALTLTASAASADTPTPNPTPSQSISPNFGVPPPVVRSCDRQVREVSPVVSPTERQTDGLKTLSPTERPTPTPIRTIEPRVICRPEHFNVALVLAGTNLGTTLLNFANATGPVNGTGTDSSVSNTLDRLNLPNVANRVNLRHTGIPFPIVNMGNCTVSVLQFGTWTFNGGQGINVRAIGNGTFRLALLAHFPNIRNTCSLAFLGSSNPLLQNRVSPDFLDVAVHGDGVAAR